LIDLFEKNPLYGCSVEYLREKAVYNNGFNAKELVKLYIYIEPKIKTIFVRSFIIILWKTFVRLG